MMNWKEIWVSLFGACEWLEYRLLGIHGCGNRDCYSDECCILGHEAANAKGRKIKAGGLLCVIYKGERLLARV